MDGSFYNTRMTIHSFADVHRVLNQYIPPARSMRGAYTLTTIKQLMNALGNPQNQYRAVHVAGTSGKTSTAYYTAALLKESGYKVGLTVSPHVDEVNERVQINLEPLDEQTYCAYFRKFLKNVEATGIKPTYFELLVAFAFWVFAQEEVDYAVVEVGLGGLLDATNVMTRADKICIITDIGLDHTTVLGRTIPAIAAQKSGIIGQHNTVVIYQQDEKIMNVVREVADQEHATLHEVIVAPQQSLPRNLSLYQQRNWYLALCATGIIRERDDKPDLKQSQLAKSTRVAIPARMEVLKRGGKTVILDAAHNAQKIETLVRSLKAKYPGESMAILMGLIYGKSEHIKPCLIQLTSIASHLIITSFASAQDMRKVSIRPSKIAEASHMLGFDKWEIVSDPKDAYRVLLHRPEKIVLITGSFFLLNDIRSEIFKSHKPI